MYRMPPCHTTPFIRAGLVIESEPAAPESVRASGAESCDYCGAESLEWRKCKLICGNCRQINKSCADL